MIPYRGTLVWVLVGFGADGVPLYRPAGGGPVLPRKGARARAAAEGLRSVFRDTQPEPAPTRADIVRRVGREMAGAGVSFALAAVIGALQVAVLLAGC